MEKVARHHFGNVDGNPVSYVDPDGTDKVRIIIELASGAKKVIYVALKDVAEMLKRGKNITIPNERRKAEKAAEQAWGKDIVCHPAHGGKSKNPHYQPRKRKGRKGHSSWTWVGATAAATGFADEFFNPVFGGEAE